MKIRGTRVQYGFVLHRNCFLLINMLENFIKFENHKIKKEKFKVQLFSTNLKISIFFLEIQNFHKIYHIALSCHVISCIDFARECNKIIYSTEIAFC
jgi:hypothetical protein